MSRKSMIERSRRRAFTLIELLMVIALIGLLAGMGLVATRVARNFVGNVSVKSRLDDIAQCVEMYKQKYGEYPPDCCADAAEIKRHILKRWPKTLKTGNVDNMVDIALAETKKGPSRALLFWLAGPMVESLDANGNTEYVCDGFYADESNPIFDPLNEDRSEPRETPLIELSYDSDGTGNGNYNGSGLIHKGKPIIYFRANPKAKDEAGNVSEYFGKDWHDPTSDSVATPYMKNGAWYNPDTYQLVYAGDDSDFGEEPFVGDDHDGEYIARDLAVPESISPADRDNVTNFSTGATIESEMEK